MLSSFRSVNKIKTFKSIGFCFKLFTNDFIDIRKGLKTYSSIKRLNAERVTKIAGRFQSTEAINEMKRSGNVYSDFRSANVKLIFNDNENQMAFKIINSILSQQKFQLNQQKPNLKNSNHSKSDDVFNKFMRIDHDNFRDCHSLIVSLAKTIRYLSLKQLSDVLELISKWPVIGRPFDPLFYKTWSNVDMELVNRLSKVNFSDNNQVLEYLYIGNQFYGMRIANITKFNLTLVHKLCSPDFLLNKTTFLHVMFYLNLHRNIENKLIPILFKTFKSLINDLNLDEIGVICMTLFKTETVLDEDLVRQVISKTLTDVSDQTDNIIRTAIIKCIRSSYKRVNWDQIKLFFDEMKCLSNNSEFTLTHLLNLKTSCQIFDLNLMNDVLNRVWSNPMAFRLKDIERILLCLSYFDFEVDLNKIQSICKELDDKSDKFETYLYPMCLLNILHYLAVLGIYYKPLIRNCFEPTFMSKILKQSKLDFENHLIATNTALSVEAYDDFKDILLPTEKVYHFHRMILTAEKSSTPVDYLTKRSALMNSIYMSLKSELHNRVKMCHILPFKSYPMIVIFDENNKNFSLTPKTELTANMVNNCIAIFILDIKDFAIVDTIIKGTTRMQIRLLERMGFKVLVISWHQLTQFNTQQSRKNKILEEIYKIDPNFSL